MGSCAPAASSGGGRTERRTLHLFPSEPLLRNHAIMPFRLRRNRPKLVERTPEMLGKLCQRSGQYPTGAVDGMATDDTKADGDHFPMPSEQIEVAPLLNSLIGVKHLLLVTVIERLRPERRSLGIVPRHDQRRDRDRMERPRSTVIECSNWLGTTVKTSFAALAALLLASAFSQAVYAQYPPPTQPYQAPPPGQPYIQIPIPVPIPGIPGVAPPPRPEGREHDREWWEHCERLRDQEHELHERLAHAPPYGEDRERLEHRLREVHYERERCRDR